MPSGQSDPAMRQRLLSALRADWTIRSACQWARCARTYVYALRDGSTPFSAEVRAELLRLESVPRGQRIRGDLSAGPVAADSAPRPQAVQRSAGPVLAVDILPDGEHPETGDDTDDDPGALAVGLAVGLRALVSIAEDAQAEDRDRVAAAKALVAAAQRSRPAAPAAPLPAPAPEAAPLAPLTAADVAAALRVHRA